MNLITAINISTAINPIKILITAILNLIMTMNLSMNITSILLNEYK